MTPPPVRINWLPYGPGRHCPGETVLAAYAEAALGSDVRDRVEAHLADCDACLAKLGLLVRLGTEAAPEVPASLQVEARRVGRTRTAAWMGLSAAAVVLASGLLLIRAGAGPPSLQPETQTIRGPESSVDILITDPVDGGVVPSSAATVRWTPVERALFYEVRVTNARGTLLWEGRSDDAVIVVPARALTDPAGGFVWVSAQLPGNRSIRSGAVSFRVEPR